MAKTQSQLAPKYAPADVEPQINARWKQNQAFHGDPAGEGAPYCIVIPPPNVTAALHMGHALNNTLQDILIRWHRMLGQRTLWMPGTDHAGIATQTVVDKRLKIEGEAALAEYKRMEADGQGGREKFIEKVQAWKDEYEARITHQLVEMGCSCDWDRQRFTMDRVCAAAVREAFFRMFKDGLIYRGKRLVNWDPVTQTALADDEVENREVDGHFYYMRYPLLGPPLKNGQNYLTVATTRPETMLGDTAVAVNPKDPRAQELRGRGVLLPIVNRMIPIIEDDYVVLPVEFGGDEKDTKAQMATGFLKVTPAHDPNDWEIGLRHELAVINVMAPDATISKDHGWPQEEWSDDWLNQPTSGGPNDAGFLLGKSPEDARQLIVEFFKNHKLLEDIKPHRHSVGHSYRSHAAIEPYLSDQWYVKVTDDRLAGAALSAMAQAQRSDSDGCVWKEGGSFDSDGGTAVQAVKDMRTASKGIGPHLEIHRRHLPHWQLGGSTYFVTFRTKDRRELSDTERRMTLDACLHWHDQRMEVHLVTVMPDHVHLLITPLKRDDRSWHSLSDLVHSIKSFSAHEINKLHDAIGPVWQDEYFDRIVRDEKEFEEKWQYMWMNPVKAALVDQPEDYHFVASGYWQKVDDGPEARPTSSSWQGQLRFYPQRYAKIFQSWHENIRDWCISRQLWWGHRIPVWAREGVEAVEVEGEYVRRLDTWEKANRIVKKLAGEKATMGPDDARTDRVIEAICVRDPEGDDREIVKLIEEHKYQQDPDVLDTWFSSALWPYSTMGWPDPRKFPDEIPEGDAVLNTWNPGNLLCTAREIITLWVSRMVMTNLYFRGCLPFTDVFIHAMIQDGYGQKMSKTLGNGVDPLDIIHSHGADGMRFTLASMTTHTQDVRMPVEPVCPHCDKELEPKTITTTPLRSRLFLVVPDLKVQSAPRSIVCW